MSLFSNELNLLFNFGRCNVLQVIGIVPNSSPLPSGLRAIGCGRSVTEGSQRDAGGHDRHGQRGIDGGREGVESGDDFGVTRDERVQQSSAVKVSHEPSVRIGPRLHRVIIVFG